MEYGLIKRSVDLIHPHVVQRWYVTLGSLTPECATVQRVEEVTDSVRADPRLVRIQEQEPVVAEHICSVHNIHWRSVVQLG